MPREHAISSDSHIDLSWMPTNVFVENAPREFKDRMPFVEDTPHGPRWTTKAGIPLGYACRLGTSGRLYTPGMSNRADRMAAEGLFSDGAKGINRVSDPKLRLQSQDRDGVDGEILYGILGITERMKDPEAAVHIARIYNDWLEDFCAYAPDRLFGLAQIPNDSLPSAMAEAERVAARGKLRGFDMAAANKHQPYYHPDWEPFWAMANETRIPVHFHTFGPSFPDMTGWDAATMEMARGSGFARGQFLRASDVIAGLIMGGVLDRYPDVRIVFAESGIGWIPYLLDRLNWAWDEEFRHTLKLSMRPSEYWYRQCYASFQVEDSALPILHLVGYDNVLWASDFPHPDGLWPDSQQFIQDMFGDLSPAIRHKMVYGNAAQLYGLTDVYAPSEPALVG